MEVFLERLTDFGAGLLPVLGHVLLWVSAVAGLVGSLFPAFPGATLIWGAAVLHGVVYGFEPLGAVTLTLLTVLMGVSIGGQYAVSALGAKRFGASGWGIAAAAAGLLIGTFAIPIPIVGSLIGAFLGAVAVEFVRVRRGPVAATSEDTEEGDEADGDGPPAPPRAEDDAAPSTDTRAAARIAARAGAGAALGAVVGLAVEFGTALVMMGVLFVGFVS